MPRAATDSTDLRLSLRSVKPRPMLAVGAATARGKHPRRRGGSTLARARGAARAARALTPGSSLPGCCCVGSGTGDSVGIVTQGASGLSLQHLPEGPAQRLRGERLLPPGDLPLIQQLAGPFAGGIARHHAAFA